MIQPEVSSSPGQVVLRGEIDMELALDVRSALEHASSAGTEIVVEVSELEFIDSSGLNELVRPTHDGHRVIIRGAQPFLLRLLSLTRLDAVLVVER